MVVVQTTTQIRLFNENDNRVVSIYLDESSEQTARIVENALLRAESGGTNGEAMDAIMGVWHDAIDLLEPAAEVVVPFARRIKMPTHRVRVRRDVNRLLDGIRVHAWIHQHARERDELGRILATEEDFRVALGLVADSFGRAWGSMTPVEEAVMGAIMSLPEAVRKNGFKRGELPVEGQDARRVQDALKALTESGHIECEKRGGPGGYRYTVPHDPKEARLGISLITADEDGESAEGPNAVAGEDPAQAGDQGEDDEEGDVARGIARIDEHVLEGPLSPGKGAIARSRGVDDEGPFEDDDPEEEEEVDYLGELTGSGWYRAEPAFVTEDVPEGAPPGEERVADALRRRVPIYHGGRAKRKWHVGDDTPLVLSAEEVPELETEEPTSGVRPTTPEEMDARMRRVISLLQQKAHRFYDPNFDEWCFESRINASLDSPNRFKEAYLHAELWRNECTGEELWALVALREGWRVPEEAIEEAVWSRVAPRNTTDEIGLEKPDHDYEF